MNKKKNLVTDDLRIKQSEEILFQDIEDELIILNINDENYLGLDQVGTRIWNVLLNCNTTKDAYGQLLEEYEVEPTTLKKDLNNFINELLKNNLVKLTSV